MIGKIEKCNIISETEQHNGLKETVNKLNPDLDFFFLEAICKRMNHQTKYPVGNWRKKIEIQALKDALFRHVLAVMQNDYNDNGIENDNLCAIALNSMFLWNQLENFKRTKDYEI